MEKKQFLLEKAQVVRELDLARGERDQYKRDLEASVKDAQASAALLERMGPELERLKKENNDLSLQVVNQDAEIEELKSTLREVTRNSNEAGPSAIKRFLQSGAFKCAALTSLVDILRFTMYRELSLLGKKFPFTPEQLGFGQIAEQDAELKDLVSYCWDEEKDELVDPNGKVVPKTLMLQTLPNPGPSYQWDSDDWPSDIPSPGTSSNSGFATPENSPVRGGTSQHEVVSGAETDPEPEGPLEFEIPHTAVEAPESDFPSRAGNVPDVLVSSIGDMPSAS